MALLGSTLTAGAGATMMAVGGLMSSKGRKPGLGPIETQSLQRKMRAQKSLEGMFQDRLRSPDQNIMPFEEQQAFQQRRGEIYGEQRGQQAQALMGRMSRTGTLASGATNYNLMRFGQQTLRDQQQFYFQDRAQRLQEREQAQATTFQMGQAVAGTPVIGGQQTDVMNARARQHNVWRNRWANVMTSMGGQTLGYGLGGMAQSTSQIGGMGQLGSMMGGK